MLPTPKSYKDIVYPRPAVEKLVDDLVHNRLPFPSTGKTGLLIWGPYGTGKTTLAKLLPQALDPPRGGQATVLARHEKLQSGNNGPGLISSLDTMIASMPMDGAYHYVILDEVDNLGDAAMKSLKNVMDGPTAIFIMTTNHPGKIDPAVISRSHQIEMTKPPASTWLPIAQQALFNAGVTTPLTSQTLMKLIELCTGDVREIDAQLEQLRLMLPQAAIPSPPNLSADRTVQAVAPILSAAKP